MDPVKDAFEKVKQDIDFLFLEIQKIKASLEEQKQVSFNFIKRTLEELKNTPTLQQITPTHPNTPTHPTHQEAFSTGNKGVSTGNEGVPTDRQTNRQTNRQTEKFVLYTPNPTPETPQFTGIDHLENVSEILDSLDELKKEVRFKFKRLTSQEMAIFTLIYQLEEQGLTVDYSLISEKLKLSESSVRDYVGKIIKKGIPVDKTKHNNKKITLSISSDLKKIASLNTIAQLRNL